MKSKRIVVRIDQAEHARAHEKARQTGRNGGLSELIRDWLAAWCDGRLFVEAPGKQ